jgi:hypothetical protein
MSCQGVFKKRWIFKRRNLDFMEKGNNNIRDEIVFIMI